jgi:hypothetical protein
MRTTLTLGDEGAIQLEDLRRSGDVVFKAVVNEALRRGLKAMTAPQPAAEKPFRTSAFDAGELQATCLENIAEALAVAEGQTFR